MMDPLVIVLLCVYGLLMLGLGYVLGQVLHRPSRPAKPPDEQQTILVKRSRPSFRHPGKTQTTAYDEYKSKSGLYAPVRPGRGSTADEIDPRD